MFELISNFMIKVIIIPVYANAVAKINFFYQFIS